MEPDIHNAVVQRGIYYAKEGHPVVYAMSPKCGCTSIQRVLKAEGFTRIYTAQARNLQRAGKTILLVVRHPLERLVSAWSFFKHYEAGPGRDISPDMSFEAFLKHTESHPDVHWMPQVEYNSDHEGFIPTDVVPLDYLDELWPELGVGKMIRIRTSTHGDYETYYDPESRAAQEARYAQDLALWRRAIDRIRSQLAEADAALIDS